MTMLNKILCLKCNKNIHGSSSPYCNSCHASNMREWRKTHRLKGLARRKMNCRSYANQYLKHGRIKKYDCEKCGDKNSQMHHIDYSKPLLIDWLCRPCHLKLHKELKCLTE